MIKEEEYILTQIENFKLNHFSRPVFESILIWYLDQARKFRRGKIGVFKNLFFTLLLIPTSIFSIIFILFDSLCRLIIEKRREIQGNVLVAGFSTSHKLVLSKVLELKNENFKCFYITSKTFKELFEFHNEEITIESQNNFISNFDVCKKQLQFLIFSFTDLFKFLHCFDYNIDLKLYFLTIFKLYKSIRFEVWIKNFYKLHNISTIYLGNDTCYRAYWIIKSNTIARSITLQHGIISNKVQYYSVSDFFLCWDHISFNEIWKNPKTQYNIIGYPKKTLNRVQIHNHSTQENLRILLVLTKLSSLNDTLILQEILRFFESNRIIVDVKLHPTERKSVNKLFKKNSNLLDYYCYHYIIVVDSSVSIDLIASEIPIISLALNADSQISKYIPSITITEFLEKLSNLQVNITDYLSELQIDTLKIAKVESDIFLDYQNL